MIRLRFSYKSIKRKKRLFLSITNACKIGTFLLFIFWVCGLFRDFPLAFYADHFATPPIFPLLRIFGFPLTLWAACGMIKMQEEQSCNPRFSLVRAIVSCLLVFLKNPRRALWIRFAGAFLYLFDDHPDFAYNLCTVHFFLVKSPEKSIDNLCMLTKFRKREKTCWLFCGCVL